MGGQEQPNSFRCENDDKLFSQLFSSVRAALLENEASQTVVGPDVARSKSSANNRQNPTPSQPRQHNENKTGQAHFVGAGKGNGFVLDPHAQHKRGGTDALVGMRTWGMVEGTQGQGRLDGVMSEYGDLVQAAIMGDAEQVLRRLRDRRRLAAASRRIILARISARHEAFVHSGNRSVARARAEGLVTARRLLYQSAHVTRRLQELLQECLGEYEKARLSRARRRRVSADTCDSVVRGMVLDLRWSRFCSRLEADACGLAKAHDLGDVGAEAEYESSAALTTTTAAAACSRRGAGKTGSSRLKPKISTAAVAASRLAPTLAQAGLGDFRILRVVALYPCPAGIGNGVNNFLHGSISSSSGADGKTVAAEPRVLDRARERVVGAGVGQRSGTGANVRQNGAKDDIPDAAGADEVVVVVSEHNTPLCVSDVLRRALVRGNGAIRMALAPNSSSPSSCLLKKHTEYVSGDKINAYSGLCGEPGEASIKSDPRDVDSGGGTKERKGRGSTKRLGKGSTSCEQSAGVDACTIVGPDPHLLLSTSGLAWVLQPPFCGTVGTQLVPDSTNSKKCTRGDRHGGNDVVGHGSGRSNYLDPGTVEAAWNDLAARRAADCPPDAVGAGTGHGGEGIGGVGCDLRRGSLSREVVWLGAIPVGARVYYCLEEVAWGTSQQQYAMETTSSFASAASVAADADVVLQRETTREHIQSPSPALAVRRGRGGTAHSTRGSTASRCDFKSSGRSYPDFVGEREEKGGADAKHASAMCFARSVSKNLAAVYTEQGKTSVARERDRQWEGRESSGSAGHHHQCPPCTKCNIWEAVLADGVAATASWTVHATADDHRHSRRFDAADGSNVGKQVLDALTALPDVLVASVNISAARRNTLHETVAVERRSADGDSVQATSAAKARAGERPSRRDKVSKRASAAAAAAATAIARNGEAKRAASTQCGALHFAPAHVLQLLGTPHCRDFVAALPPAVRTKIRRALGDHESDSWPPAPPPVARLYVALGAHVSPATWSNNDDSGRVASAVAGTSPEAAMTATTAEDDADSTGGSVDNLPLSPLIGALLRPLPERAMRELLQIYVATTRGVSASTATLDCEERPFTSGLFCTPSPSCVNSTPFAPRKLSTEIRAPYGEQRDGGGGGGGEAQEATERGLPQQQQQQQQQQRHGGALAGLQCQGRVDAGSLVWEDGPTAEKRPGVGGARSENSDNDEDDDSDDDNEEEDEGQQQQRRSAGIGEGHNYDCAAAVPPSALDILPDSPDLCDDLSFGDFDILTSAGCGVAGSVAAPEVGHGVEPRLRGQAAEENTRIASSLRTRYHRSYVAVLTPQVPTAATAATAAATVRRTNTCRSEADDWFAGASAFLLQMEGANDSANKRSLDRHRRRNAERKRHIGSVACGAGGGSDGNAAGEEMKETWEVGVPEVCLWRGCLSDASCGSSLCLVHFQLKEFLDVKAAKARTSSEARRFLPPGCLGSAKKQRRSSLRKKRASATSTSSRDTGGGGGGGGGTTAFRSPATHAVNYGASFGLHDIAAAAGEGEVVFAHSMSPLLSELFNGKLASTIRLFCQRAVAESSGQQRRGRGSSRKSWVEDDSGADPDFLAAGFSSTAQAPGIPQGPGWTRWIDPQNVEDADRQLEDDMRWTEQVLKVEKEVTAELRRLSGLRVYPEAELARIRQEHEALTGEWRQAVRRPCDDNCSPPWDSCKWGARGEEDEEEQSSVGGRNVAEPRGGGRDRLRMLSINDRANAPAALAQLDRTRFFGSRMSSTNVHSISPAVAAASTFTGAATDNVMTASALDEGSNRPRVRQGKHALTMPNELASREGCSDGVGGVGGGGGGSDDYTVAGKDGGVQRRREVEIELGFCEMKRNLLRRRRNEAELAKISTGTPAPSRTLLPPYDYPLVTMDSSQTCRSMIKDLGRLPPSSGSSAEINKSPDAVQVGGSVTRLHGAQGSVGTLCVSATGGSLSPTDSLQDQSQHQRQSHLPSAAASSRSSSPISPGKTRPRQTVPATTGNSRFPQAAAPGIVRGLAPQTKPTSRHSKDSAQNQHCCWQQQQNHGRRRHSSPLNTNTMEAASSSDPGRLLTPSVGVCQIATSVNKNKRGVGGCTLASLAVSKAEQTKVDGTANGHNDGIDCNEGSWSGDGGGGGRGGGGSDTRNSLLPRRRKSAGSVGGNGRISRSHQQQHLSPFASRVGSGRGRGFDAAPYQTTVLFRDR